jgi:hypothetical protein
MVAAVSVALPASQASASCAPTPSIEESLQSADLVFVGTVVELNNRNRWATFTLEDIWKGEPASPRLDVRGGPPGGQATSVDRTFELDKRYLVFARKGERHWEDNACSATRLYDQSHDASRPPLARTVVTVDNATEGGGGINAGTGVFAVVVLVVVVGGYVVVRRWGRNTIPS